ANVPAADRRAYCGGAARSAHAIAAGALAGIHGTAEGRRKASRPLEPGPGDRTTPHRDRPGLHTRADPGRRRVERRRVVGPGHRVRDLREAVTAGDACLERRWSLSDVCYLSAAVGVSLLAYRGLLDVYFVYDDFLHFYQIVNEPW